MLSRLLLIRRGEWGVVGSATTGGFLLLGAINLVRPLRDAIAASCGVEALPWLITATMLATLAISPAVAFIVSRWGGRGAVVLQLRAFALVLAVVGGLRLTTWGAENSGLDLAFFIGVGVFTLVVVSAFWGWMSECFEDGHAERLFGLIAAGTTLGAIGGSAVVAGLARTLGEAALILSAAALVEGAVQCLKRLRPRATCTAPVKRTAAFAGAKLVGESAYLRRACLYMLLFSLTSTIMYFEQAHVIGTMLATEQARAAALGRLALGSNLLTLLIQVVLTGRLIGRFGVGGALSITPAIAALGFAGLLAWPTLGVLTVAQVGRLGVHYAVDRPAREMLYTVLSSDHRFKAKSFIDTFVYRVGDLLGAWLSGLLPALGVGGLIVAIPISIAWLITGLSLGAERRRLRDHAAPGAVADPA